MIKTPGSEKRSGSIMSIEVFPRDVEIANPHSRASFKRKVHIQFGDFLHSILSDIA